MQPWRQPFKQNWNMGDIINLYITCGHIRLSWNQQTWNVSYQSKKNWSGYPMETTTITTTTNRYKTTSTKKHAKRTWRWALATSRCNLDIRQNVKWTLYYMLMCKFNSSGNNMHKSLHPVAIRCTNPNCKSNGNNMHKSKLKPNKNIKNTNQDKSILIKTNQD